MTKDFIPSANGTTPTPNPLHDERAANSGPSQEPLSLFQDAVKDAAIFSETLLNQRKIRIHNDLNLVRDSVSKLVAAEQAVNELMEGVNGGIGPWAFLYVELSQISDLLSSPEADFNKYEAVIEAALRSISAYSKFMAHSDVSTIMRVGEDVMDADTRLLELIADIKQVCFLQHTLSKVLSNKYYALLRESEFKAESKSDSPLTETREDLPQQDGHPSHE